MEVKNLIASDRLRNIDKYSITATPKHVWLLRKNI